jgi:carboxypeptidase C (cathepsin A)
MRSVLRIAIANACLGATCVLSTLAQEAPSSPTPDEAGSMAPPLSDRMERPKKIDPDIATAPVKEARVVTHHSGTFEGKVISYEATAGTLTIRNDLGKPTASMFYVAYVMDKDQGEHRPITFFYNGGPGSASLWLHLGSFGPVRVLTDSPEATHGAPFQLEANNETLLGKTDMVFLDAIGAGYSRGLGETKDEKFWGVDADIGSFSRAIMRYLTINDRWNSPKFLFGESYGTTRSAGLVFELQKQNVQFNGVTILSSILNYGIRDAGFDRSYVAYIPTFAAAAWYHAKVNPKPADLSTFLTEVRAYAAGPYLLALDKGGNLGAEEENAVAQRLSAYTGLSVAFLKECHLRVSLGRFRKELLRDQHRSVGRYDSRFLSIDSDDVEETPEIDPSSEYIGGAFVAAFHDYLSIQLNYHSDLEYRLHGIDTYEKWDWHHKPPGALHPEPVADVALDLAAAMRANPHLRLLSLNGWYDMATPFFETEYDLDHMFLDASLRDHVHFAYYPSGHMVYLNPEALKLMKADVEHFYDEAAP